MQHETNENMDSVMLVSIDIKIENNNFTADTDCMLLLLFLFKQFFYLFFVHLLKKDLAL